MITRRYVPFEMALPMQNLRARRPFTAAAEVSHAHRYRAAGLFFVFFLRQIFQGPARDGFHLYFRLASLLGMGFGFLNQDSFVDAGLWIPLVLCFALNQGNRDAASTV